MSTPAHVLGAQKSPRHYPNAGHDEGQSSARCERLTSSPELRLQSPGSLQRQQGGFQLVTALSLQVPTARSVRYIVLLGQHYRAKVPQHPPEPVGPCQHRCDLAPRQLLRAT